METKTGTIFTMKKDKGYGFIKPDDQNKANIFFHASKVLCPKFEELGLNERVEYLEVETPKGLQAVDIAVC